MAAEATAVLPHAHYLGRTLEGYAELPDGTKRPLIRIPQWDFNWQGEYRYKEALHLPAGTTLVMDYRFDNSDQNIANPHDPPQRVRYGPKTVDEMSELAIQLVTDSRRDYALLKNDFDRWRVTEELIPYLRRVLSDRERDQTELDSAQLNWDWQRHCSASGSEPKPGSSLPRSRNRATPTRNHSPCWAGWLSTKGIWPRGGVSSGKPWKWNRGRSMP